MHYDFTELELFFKLSVDLFGVHESTVSRIIKRVSIALASLYKQYVKFPSGNKSSRNSNAVYAAKQNFWFRRCYRLYTFLSNHQEGIRQNYSATEKDFFPLMFSQFVTMV